MMRIHFALRNHLFLSRFGLIENFRNLFLPEMDYLLAIVGYSRVVSSSALLSFLYGGMVFAGVRLVARDCRHVELSTFSFLFCGLQGALMRLEHF